MSDVTARQAEFAAALGLAPDGIIQGNDGDLIYHGEEAQWTLTYLDTIEVEYGCMTIDIDVLHSIGATVKALAAAMVALNAALGVAILEDSQ